MLRDCSYATSACQVNTPAGHALTTEGATPHACPPLHVSRDQIIYVGIAVRQANDYHATAPLYVTPMPTASREVTETGRPVGVADGVEVSLTMEQRQSAHMCCRGVHSLSTFITFTECKFIYHSHMPNHQTRTEGSPPIPLSAR